MSFWTWYSLSHTDHSLLLLPNNTQFWLTSLYSASLYPYLLQSLTDSKSVPLFPCRLLLLDECSYSPSIHYEDWLSPPSTCCLSFLSVLLPPLDLKYYSSQDSLLCPVLTLYSAGINSSWIQLWPLIMPSKSLPLASTFLSRFTFKFLGLLEIPWSSHFQCVQYQTLNISFTALEIPSKKVKPQFHLLSACLAIVYLHCWHHFKCNLLVINKYVTSIHYSVTLHSTESQNCTGCLVYTWPRSKNEK